MTEKLLIIMPKLVLNNVLLLTADHVVYVFDWMPPEIFSSASLVLA